MKRIAVGAALATVAALVIKRLPLERLRRFRPGLTDLTKEELYQRAQDAEIAGRSQMSKNELIAALKEA